MRQIEAKDLKSTDQILDVRTLKEYQEMSLTLPHHHVELYELNPETFFKMYELDRKKPLYIICHSGRRAAIATVSFQQEGYANVGIVKGGIVRAVEQGVQTVST